MPLISLTAAQRFTFLTPISSSDPSSRARQHSISEAEGTRRDAGSGMQGEDGGTNGNLHKVTILFYLQVFEAGTLRPDGRRDREDEPM